MNTINDAKKGIQRVIDYLKENENVWNTSRTLKLYDAFFKSDELMNQYPLVAEKYNASDLFYWFCEDSLEEFTEWMKECDISDCREYIGRTSSFYLTDLHDDNMNGVIETLIDYNYGWLCGLELSVSDSEINIEITEEEEEAPANLDYLANDFLDDVKRYLADAVKIAEYIDGFMQNQVGYFKEFIEFRNEILKEEAEEEAKKEADFLGKYSELISAMTNTFKEIIEKTGSEADARGIVYRAMGKVEA